MREDEKLMSCAFSSVFATLRKREVIGFGLFVAWMFCSLFGCGLAQVPDEVVGKPTAYRLEFIWMMCGFAEIAGGALGLAFLRDGSRAQCVIEGKATYIAAFVLGIAGNALIYLAFTDYYGLFWRVFPLAGLCMGAACALLVVIWATRMAGLDENTVELSVMCAFALAYAVYFVLLLTKVAAELFAAFMVPVLFAAVYLAYESPRRERASSACSGISSDAAGGALVGGASTKDESVDCVARASSDGARIEGAGFVSVPARHLVSLAALSLFLWLSIAYFRVISSPATMGDRFAHYLVPFGFACVVSLALVVLYVCFSRSLNITLAFRWSLPFLVASYIPVFIDFDDPHVRILSYAINFMGMFGVMFGIWMSACKHMRREHSNPFALMGAYLIGEGAGIFIGCVVGLHVMFDEPSTTVIVVGLSLLTLLVLAVMSFGFDPYWVSPRSNVQTVALVANERGENVSCDGLDENAIDAMFLLAALRLKDEFGLTAREVDVAAMLAAGRSRTYIRDRLMISINTVGSHSRNIFAKCNVHSQQELMSLAREHMS